MYCNVRNKELNTETKVRKKRYCLGMDKTLSFRSLRKKHLNPKALGWFCSTFYQGQMWPWRGGGGRERSYGPDEREKSHHISKDHVPVHTVRRNGPHFTFYRAYTRDASLYGPYIYALTQIINKAYQKAAQHLTYDASFLEKKKKKKYQQLANQQPLDT